MILLKKKNAGELEAIYAKETATLSVPNPNAKPLTQHTSMNFPTYDDYKDFGRDYKPNWKKK